ncbi:hypothetical protein HME9302_00979 [Alteripontixanthobacter maritimus]|uniref:Uncharacterized protein n=1 Tax=Alteripontixanthobacter maritimus TaxID=2161824 RepID=A0A369Q4Y0_9SPHN|nr:hypothetical protein [Alteripontixanthobacter maritimus]RDC59784.1 hypothetical protein HME9302_00979 [Alteripontixanthobacter maritimus]
MIYVTTRDIVIAAGTALKAPPVASTRWGKDYKAVIADGRDNTVYFTADVHEALASGLLRKAD